MLVIPKRDCQARIPADTCEMLHGAKAIHEVESRLKSRTQPKLKLEFKLQLQVTVKLELKLKAQI